MLKRIITKLLPAVLAAIKPILIALLLLILVFCFIYFSTFMLPRFISYESNTPVVYRWGKEDTWGKDQDIELYKQYYKLDHNWMDKFESFNSLAHEEPDEISGNGADEESTVKGIWGSYMAAFTPEANKSSSIISEKEQVNPHRVPWSLLASLDKVLGDPIVHGKEGRRPEPEKHFEKLKPKLEWKDFELYYYRRWEETYTTTNSNDEEVEKTKTYREEYKHDIRLLTTANSYEANFKYNWEDKVVEREHEDSEGDESYTKIIIPELKNVQRQGPYYEPLRNILKKHGLNKDLELELVLRLAMNMDDNFNVDAGAMNSLLEILWSSEINRYNGSAGDFIRPVEGRISSVFGIRIHPITHKRDFHSGIDIAASKGEEVVSAAKGLVILARKVKGYGKTVIIDHGNYKTLYGHLSSISVNYGDELSQGQKIGRVGSTGVSTGPHLHFEMRKGTGKTKFINPLSVI